jgi:hypothetical protein
LLRKVPKEIDDDEVVIRAIMSPYHIHKKRNNQITGKAFEAPPEKDEVSVTRGRYVSAWLAKMYAKAWVQRPRATQPKMYRGLAFIPVNAVRSHGSCVHDSRKEYLGHADITHGVVVKRAVGEALDPRVRKDLDDRLKKLAEAATYVEDPNPRSLFWTGMRM